jgi:plastocyanin
MSQLANQNKPAHLEGVPQTTGHRALSALTRVTLVALLGNALAYTAYIVLFALLLHHVFLPAYFIASIPAVLAAGLVATRWRWIPAVGAALVLIISTLFFSQPLLQYYLTHPAYRPAFFFAGVLILACGFIAVVAGLSATLQNYRTHASVRPAPSWLRPLLLVLSGVIVGMSIVALLVIANPQASSANSTTTGEPTVHMGADNFVQNVVRVPKGSKLLLVNDTTVEHMLENGSWTSSSTVVTTAEPGAPVLHNVDSKGGSSLEIGPFTTAGIFHIHCTIHPGMNLTIIVQ